MELTIRKHAGAALVAVSISVAALFEGSFDPTAYAAASILIWAAVIAGLVGRALPAVPIAGTAAVAGLCLGALALLAGAFHRLGRRPGAGLPRGGSGVVLPGPVHAGGLHREPRRARPVAGGADASASASSRCWRCSSLPAAGAARASGARRPDPGAADRLSYPIGYWNGLAALLAIAAVLLAHAGARAPERSAAVARRPRWLPLALLAIWLTDSRGGEAAAAVRVWPRSVAASPDRPRQLRRRSRSPPPEARC